MSLKHLTSKLLAGGLTAGIALIWWPTHYPTSGMEWLVARGVLATLGFELMFLAFSAVEDHLAARLQGRVPRLARLNERIARAPRAARTGFVLAAGGAALALPVTALVSAGSPLPHHSIGKAHAATKPERVVRQVVVRRQVVHDEVVVTTPAAPSSAAPARQGTTTTRPAARTTPKRTATTRTPTATTQATTTTTTPAASAPGPAATTTDTTATADGTSTAPTTTTP